MIRFSFVLFCNPMNMRLDAAHAYLAIAVLRHIRSLALERPGIQTLLVTVANT